MSTEPRKLLDAWLDGSLTGPQRAAFEKQLGSDAELREAVAIQKQIDAALRKSFGPPSAEGHVDRLISGFSDKRRQSSRPWWVGVRGITALAAMIMLGVGVAWWAGVLGGADEPAAGPKPWRSLATVYQDEVKGGFKPEWVCRDDQEFATTFYRRFYQGMLMAQAPNVTCVGISYSNSITPLTTHLLVDVGEADKKARAVVFVDLKQKDKGQSVPPDTGLKLYRRELGKLVLYELSPLDEPRALALFHEKEMPAEWLKAAGYTPPDASTNN
jgi:hypothetical protein